MFKDIPEGWYSRDGKNQCCRLCNFLKTTRYTMVEGKLFSTLKPFETSLWYRIKELFT